MNHPYDTQLHSLPLKPQLRTYVCKRYQQTAYLPYFVDLDLTLYIPLSSKPSIKPRPQDLSARSRNPQSNPDERLHYLYLPPLNPIACLTMCELTITIIISSAGKPPGPIAGAHSTAAMICHTLIINLNTHQVCCSERSNIRNHNSLS